MNEGRPKEAGTGEAGMGEVRRRGFLRGAARGLGSAVAAAGLVGADRPAVPQLPAGFPQSVAHAEFHGPHQAGILRPAQPATVFAAFDVTADGRRELTELLRTLTERARFLTTGGTPPSPGITAPPTDSGVLGPVVPPGGLTVTAGIGASLFDGRFGLQSRKPLRLAAMPAFPDDDLDPAMCHGDLSAAALRGKPRHGAARAAGHRPAHPGRDAGALAYGRLHQPVPAQRNPRNHMGFKDGIANPDATDGRSMDRLVWVGDGGAEPAWTAGGTYQVVRLIRMLVEFWDRVSITEQERMFGRSRDTGAPLDGTGEFDAPKYPQDPKGDVIPLDSHIRLANPRDPRTDGQRILRRAYNYDRGMDSNGNLDMGLLFCCYQQDLARQFETVQKRLAGEPLVDYIIAVRRRLLLRAARGARPHGLAGQCPVHLRNPARPMHS